MSLGLAHPAEAIRLSPGNRARTSSWPVSPPVPGAGETTDGLAPTPGPPSQSNDAGVSGFLRDGLGRELGVNDRATRLPKTALG